MIDVQNHSRQHGLELENVWGAQRWQCRAFSASLGASKVDYFLACSLFEKKALQNSMKIVILAFEFSPLHIHSSQLK